MTLFRISAQINGYRTADGVGAMALYGCVFARIEYAYQCRIFGLACMCSTVLVSVDGCACLTVYVWTYEHSYIITTPASAVTLFQLANTDMTRVDIRFENIHTHMWWNVCVCFVRAPSAQLVFGNIHSHLWLFLHELTRPALYVRRWYTRILATCSGAVANCQHSVFVCVANGYIAF